jgi:hypothetical protein
MRNAIDQNGEPEGRVGVFEPEQGDHAVHVDEQYGAVFRDHRGTGR